MTTIKQHRIDSDRAYLTALLQRHGYNVSAAAREAGVMRTSLYNLMKLRGVSPLNPRAPRPRRAYIPSTQMARFMGAYSP